MTICPAECVGHLTLREQQVMVQLRMGVANKHIAHALGISEWTVKTHLTRIYAKLKVRNRMQAALASQERAGASQ